MMTFNLDPKRGRVLVEVVEVLCVELRSKEGVTVHSLSEGLKILKVLGVNRFGRFFEVWGTVSLRRSEESDWK